MKKRLQGKGEKILDQYIKDEWSIFANEPLFERKSRLQGAGVRIRLLEDDKGDG